MEENVVAVFIPIVGTLVIGIILVSYFFFRSRERQMLIEKGMDAQSIKEFFEGRKDPFRMLKIGIVTIGFGLGLGIGIMLNDSTHQDHWVPLFLFTITGVGFVAANIVSRKLEKK
jgi:purine-cytosine permease-like protein